VSTIQVKFGNLMEENATFIVNASNTELVLGSGVSMAFNKHCSQGNIDYQTILNILKEEYSQIVKGDVIVSNSGSADNFQYALHLAVMNYSDKNIEQKPTYKDIELGLTNIIKIIQDKIISEHIKTPKLVIPLVGCGVGGLDKKKVFTMIANRFSNVDFELTTVIYLYDSEDYKWIKELVSV